MTFALLPSAESLNDKVQEQQTHANPLTQN